MCGIAGIVSNNGQRVDPAVCQRMTQALEHRGPDDQGHWHSDFVAVGMRRLSIIDLETGAQPIWGSPEHGIVFNGEIYNYRELKAELEAKGYRFHTNSDTEVVLKLYMEDGYDFLTRLNGMFGLCIMDLARNELILARDRYGEKPLYYSNDSVQFAFASEIKALEPSFSEDKALNHEALSHYLTLRFVPEPLTMWQDVHKLTPGHFIVYNLDKHSFRVARYWSLDFKSEPFDPARDYVGEFRDLFLNSVNQRILASDVPVGVMLSGGLDSTLITQAARETGHESLHTFSVGYKESDYSEDVHATRVAKYFGTQHHAVEYSYEVFLDRLPDYIWNMDEPLGDSATIPLGYLCHQARNHIKVALTGEGADELFGGYMMDTLARRAVFYERALSHIPKNFFHLAAALQGRGSRRGRTFSQMAREGWGAYLAGWPVYPAIFWSEAEKQTLFPALRSCVTSHDLIRRWYSKAHSPYPLDKYMSVLSHDWLTENLLMKADKMSMQESLELRCPFLDYPLAEWAQRLALTKKVGDRQNGFTTKAVLREFGLNRIPDDIINRPKQGFINPTLHWIKENIDRWLRFVYAEDSALNKVLGLSPSIDLDNPALIESEHEIEKLWLLVLLDLWLRRWVLHQSYDKVRTLIHAAFK